LFSINRFSLTLLLSASLWAADGPLWEPGKVVAVEQVSSPAKTPDPSCRAIPKGATPPPSCRPANLRAEEFWRVTVEVGNRRFVARPYRAPSLLDSLNPDGTVYVDPNLTAASSVEVAVISSKTIRLRTDQGQGVPAIVDSQELLSSPAVLPTKPELPAPPRPNTSTPVASASSKPTAKVVLLKDGDFLDLENHPEITFRSTSVVSHSGSDFVLAGELTIRGVTREVELAVEFDGLARSPWGQEVIAFTATTEIDREEFGITWNAALETGGVLVGKDVTIELDLQGSIQA